MMNKLSLILLVAVVCSLTAAAAHAGTPPTSFYLASPGQPCRLPDATGRPEEVLNSEIEMIEPADNLVQMKCIGALPAGSTIPESVILLNYYDTKVLCGTWYDGSFLLSRSYSATVSPTGTSEISCMFQIP